jgi:hypothetical protein
MLFYVARRQQKHADAITREEEKSEERTHSRRWKSQSEGHLTGRLAVIESIVGF